VQHSQNFDSLFFRENLESHDMCRASIQCINPAHQLGPQFRHKIGMGSSWRVRIIGRVQSTLNVGFGLARRVNFFQFDDCACQIVPSWDLVQDG
jgi:hypothetical protein